LPKSQSRFLAWIPGLSKGDADVAPFFERDRFSQMPKGIDQMLGGGRLNAAKYH
jgi:hypothetical protein